MCKILTFASVRTSLAPRQRQFANQLSFIRTNMSCAADKQRVVLVQDPVHGAMELLPCQQELSSTPHFQRLKRLSQLGVSSFVYPGATHTRAEHSLGVAWLTRLLLRSLRLHQPHLDITERDEMLLVLAAQAHDMGHGAFSHAYEGWLHNSMGLDQWTHEERSVALLRDAANSGLVHCIEGDVLAQSRIEAFILGTPARHVPDEVLPRNKRWMLDIVNNARNGIDVDKLDYLQRDAYHALGSSDGGLLSVQRILDNMRVVDGGRRLAFHVKLVETLYHLFYRRAAMFRAVYQHTTVVGVELMLRAALTHLFCARNFMLLRDAVTSRSVEPYLMLDDTLLQQARTVLHYCSAEERERDANLAHACDLVDRIERRDLYRCVARATVSAKEWNMLAASARTSTALKSFQWVPREVHDLLMASKARPLHVHEPLALHTSRFHYGNGDRDPLDNVFVFDWRQPERVSRCSAREKTRMRPRRWCEYTVRVYAKFHVDEICAAAIEHSLEVFLRNALAECKASGAQDADESASDAESLRSPHKRQKT